MLIAAGFGGGLDPALQVGDLFIGANYSDEAVLGSLVGKFQTGTLVTTGEVIETREAKADLARRAGAACVDMETAEIFRQCQLRQIPMAPVRAISDTAGEDLPVPAQVWFDAERQRPRPVALVWHLLTHPGRIAPFARFVSGINRARAALTKFLDGNRGPARKRRRNRTAVHGEKELSTPAQPEILRRSFFSPCRAFFPGSNRRALPIWATTLA